MTARIVAATPAVPRSIREPRPKDAPVSKVAKKLLGQIAQASAEFGLIEPGDRILVAVSGGKDSHALVNLLHRLRQRAPFHFELIAVNLDQGHPGYPKHLLPEYFEAQDYDYRIVEEDTYAIVQEKVPVGNTTCGLCSRLRRGILYNIAEELGATKIALGHHRDDSIETLMLNLFYSGQLKAMPAKLHSDDGRNVVIRPLIFCAESDIIEYAEEQRFPIIPCNLCGSQENLKRQEVKQLLASLEQSNPKLRGNLLAALGNVRPSHLLDASLLASQHETAGAKPKPETRESTEPASIIPLEALLRSKSVPDGPAGLL